MRDYKNIRAYQYANKLVLHVYKITKGFPKEELYGLTSQIRRAAVSVAANIIEGASRQHLKEYLNFLYNARGSLAEVEYMINLSNELEYINKSDFDALSGSKQDVAKTLFGLIDAVSKEV